MLATYSEKDLLELVSESFMKDEYMRYRYLNGHVVILMFFDPEDPFAVQNLAEHVPKLDEKESWDRVDFIACGFRMVLFTEKSKLNFESAWENSDSKWKYDPSGWNFWLEKFQQITNYQWRYSEGVDVFVLNASLVDESANVDFSALWHRNINGESFSQSGITFDIPQKLYWGTDMPREASEKYENQNQWLQQRHLLYSGRKITNIFEYYVYLTIIALQLPVVKMEGSPLDRFKDSLLSLSPNDGRSWRSYP